MSIYFGHQVLWNMPIGSYLGNDINLLQVGIVVPDNRGSNYMDLFSLSVIRIVSSIMLRLGFTLFTLLPFDPNFHFCIVI